MAQSLGDEITVLNKVGNVLLAAHYRIPDSEVRTIRRSKVGCSKVGFLVGTNIGIKKVISSLFLVLLGWLLVQG